MARRLVALGDSTVEGLMDLGPDGVPVGWADRFATALGRQEPDLLYANLGVRGQTAREVRDTQLRRAVSLHPDVALLVAGVNDLLRPHLDRDALRGDLLAMYATLTASGARVLSFTMPDMSRVAPLTFALRGRIDFLSDVVREAGASYGVMVVDFADVPVAGHPALWHDDRLHANSEGHRRIASALAEAYGLPSAAWPVVRWRADLPETAAAGRARIVAREARWLAGHVAPWLWGRLLRHEYATGGRCKRPDLAPLAGSVDADRADAGG